MSINKSCRKLCPDFIVNDFVTNAIKTVPIRSGYRTIRVTTKNDKSTDKSVTFCALTPLSVVCRKGCLVDIVDIVIKSVPNNTKLKQLIPINKLLLREVFFYNTILVDLHGFEEERKLSLGDKFEATPTLIAASVEEGDEAIILQNTGWVPKYEKWIGELTQTHLLVVLKEFSHLHALCFAFSHKNPDKFKEYRAEVGANLSTFENRQTIVFIKNCMKQTLEFLNDNELETKLKSFEETVASFVEETLNESPEINVLVHGDPTDNFLFSYEKNEDKNVASRSKLINWQLVRLGSPVLDLSLFLFTNSDDLNNLHVLLKHYHVSLASKLKAFECNVDSYFSFEQLEEHWRKFAKVGLALTFLALKMSTNESKYKLDVNDSNVSFEDYEELFERTPNQEFRRRIKDVVKYCVQNNLI